MQLRPMGRHAVLVTELAVDPAAFATAVRGLGLRGVVDVVPAAETVLVRCDGDTSLRALQASIGDIDLATAVRSPASATVTLEVVYDGDDLAAVAASAHMTVDEVVAAHTAAEHTVAFCGFAPGFGYLTGLPAPLHLPRRATPRTRVPAGAVAIAGGFSAVYPRSSPGGWHLIGRCDAVLFDVDRDPPALLRPGDHVRFVAT